MLLIDAEPTKIWKMLLPKKNVLFSNESQQDDLIFFYRDQIYFTHRDGAVVRMRRPEHLEKMTPDDLWEWLFHEKDAFDYDDHGMFSIGAVLTDMGYLIQINQKTNKNYRVELINVINDDQKRWIQFNEVPFEYALSQALMECYRMNEESDGVDEFDVLQVIELEQPLERMQ